MLPHVGSMIQFLDELVSLTFAYRCLPAIKALGVSERVKGLKTGKNLSTESSCFHKDQMLYPDSHAQSTENGFHYHEK